MENKARGIEEIIQQAMRDGAFENLPGKGKPLELSDNPYLDREWQLAYHLLKENGFAPDFIERRQAIELDLARAREALARSWAWRRRALEESQSVGWVESEWGKARNRFEESILKINEQIKSYNLVIESPIFHRTKVDLATEVGKITLGQ